MSRAARLLNLLQVLSRHRYPVAGAALASELGISIRTLYRDVGSLQSQGADIVGEPGLGYVLRPGFLLPSMMFSSEEIEALVLGSRWVAERGDARLATAARNALARIAAVLPPELRGDLDSAALLVGPTKQVPSGDRELAAMRQAIRAERKLAIRYLDLDEVASERTVWPFALAYFERVRMLLAWCELRNDFRHFRTDRITELGVGEVRYPKRRQALLKEWRLARGIPAPL
jgi:predicted DNA-binding transcriptional regulator YafY